MRGLAVRSGVPALYRDMPNPVLMAGEALIEPVRAAVSTTDVERCRGLGPDGVIGHQFSGIVRDVESGADRSWIGQRIVCSSTTCCGTCALCTRGLSEQCLERSILGIDGLNGCFADRCRVPVRNLVALPDEVDDDHAVFAHDVAAALHAVRQLTVAGKPYVTVLGDGPLGLITAQLLRPLNDSIRVIGRYTEKLALCEKWGVKHRHADDIGRRADQDIVVDCTGSVEGLNLAARLVRPRGTILLKSMLSPERREQADLTRIVTREINIVGSFGGSMADAVNTLHRLDVDVVSLIARRMRLDDGPAILEAAASPGVLKVVVEI